MCAVKMWVSEWACVPVGRRKALLGSQCGELSQHTSAVWMDLQRFTSTLSSADYMILWKYSLDSVYNKLMKEKCVENKAPQSWCVFVNVSISLNLVFEFPESCCWFENAPSIFISQFAPQRTLTTSWLGNSAWCAVLSLEGEEIRRDPEVESLRDHLSHD